MKKCIIFNPAARGEKAWRLRTVLEGFGGHAILKPTWGPGAATELAVQAVAEGFETVVAAGGDGTINEVVNGLAGHPDGLASVRLGVLSAGTANVLAIEYGLPSDPVQAWEIVCAGRERLIDLPQAVFRATEGTSRRYFTQLAGAGFDAHAVKLVDFRLKKRFGKAAYAWAALRARTMARGHLKVLCSGSVYPARWVVVGNGRYYGGKYRFFPQAECDDGKLDLCLFERFDILFLIRCWLRMLRGGALDLPGIRHLQQESCEIQSETQPHLELDGEYVGTLPASFTVQKRKLRLLCSGPLASDMA